MESSKNSNNNCMNETVRIEDQEEGLLDTDSLEGKGLREKIDPPIYNRPDTSHYDESTSCSENSAHHMLLKHNSKKRENTSEMEFNSDPTFCKVLKLDDHDIASKDSNTDVNTSTSKKDDENTCTEKTDVSGSEVRASSSTHDCTQATIGGADASPKNLVPSESPNFLESGSEDVANADENEPVPSTSGGDKSSKSSEDTSSCCSTSSSSDFLSTFSSDEAEEEEEEEDDHFGFVSHEGINSEDEQNSETDDDKLPPVLQKMLPADKFSFPKEILLRQINSGDGKRRRYSNFESKVYGSRRMVQRLKLFNSLKKHDGCVNTLSFNDTGKILISASDDKHISLWNWAENKNLLHFNSGHVANVFQAKFLPHSNDRVLISCGQDRHVRKCLLDGCGLKSTSLITKHGRAVHKIAMQPQMPNSFLTAGEDGVVYSIDIRERDTFCTELLKVHRHRSNSTGNICLYSIHCNPVKNFEFIVGGSYEKIRLYDQRNISSKRQNPVNEYHVGCDLLDQEEGMLTTVTCAVYNHNGTEILASYNDNDVFLFNSNEPSRYAFRYDGHRNITTIKGVNFFGPQSEFVVSGSDCGYIYIWDKKSESVVQWLKGDKDIVNCLEPHPSFPVLATSGLDSDVKIWMPTSLEGCEDITDKKEFQKVVKKNLYYKLNNYTSSRDGPGANFVYFLVRAREG